ncbi:MAG: hypothetical protein ACOY93_19405 [Bacillota bacterium]
MFIGGVLIRRFDGFRRLCRHAAEQFRLDLFLPEEDLLLANRVLAAMGGPPAASQVKGSFRGDGLALLLLFLLTQEYPCRVGLIGPSEPVIARLKALTHLLGHALWPVLSGRSEPLTFQEVVRELGPSGAQLRPVFHYDADGEPTSMAPSGATASLGIGAENGPYTLAVLLSPHPGPAPLAQPATLHPAVLLLTS